MGSVADDSLELVEVEVWRLWVSWFTLWSKMFIAMAVKGKKEFWVLGSEIIRVKMQSDK